MSNKEDLTIQQVGVPNLNAPSKPLTPTYLAVLEPESGKALSYFVATRFDEHPSFAKMVGFYSSAPEKDIINNIEGVLQKAPKSDYVECWFPWGQVIKVRSLVYRHR